MRFDFPARARLLTLVHAWIVCVAALPACEDEPPLPELVPTTPDVRSPCPAPEPWTVVVLDQAMGCGIGIGADRDADALAGAAPGDVPFTIHDSEMLGDDPARSVAVALGFWDSGGAFRWEHAYMGFETCEPDLSALLAECEGCEVVCQQAVAGCDDCCVPPIGCSEETPCCGGQLCVRTDDVGAPGPGTVCADPCVADADCGPGEHCAELDGVEERACLGDDGPGPG